MASLALHSHSVGMPACSVLWFQACFLLQLRHGALLGQLVTSGMMLRTLRIAIGESHTAFCLAIAGTADCT